MSGNERQIQVVRPLANCHLHGIEADIFYVIAIYYVVVKLLLVATNFMLNRAGGLVLIGQKLRQKLNDMAINQVTHLRPT